MQANINNIDDKIRRAEESGANLNKLDMMVCAMWELMLEKGFTREQMNAKLDHVREINETLAARKNVILCPNCGKKIIENTRTPFEGTCLYCGKTVTIYPGDSIEIKGAEAQPDPSSDPLADMDQPMQEINRPSIFGDQGLF